MVWVFKLPHRSDRESVSGLLSPHLLLMVSMVRCKKYLGVAVGS